MPPELIKVQIADVGAALQLLSEVYTDARRALAEFISNSADAFVIAERQGIKRDWRCILKMTRNQITVTDNGPGITHGRLLELPAKVTLSAKRGDFAQKGYKAIGLLAFASFCKEMRIVSRAEGENQTYEACWTSECLAHPDLNPVKVDLVRERPLSEPGTRVVLSGVFEDRLHQLNVQTLSTFLRAEFSPDLRGKQYELIVADSKESHEVRPGNYPGVQFPKMSLKTGKGEKIEIELYLTQRPLYLKVALFVRGKQVVPNIGDQVEFSEGPWKSGRIAGEVRCNFLRPTTGRAGIEHGEEWRRFVEALKSVEGEVQEHLDRIAEEQRARQVHRIFKEINQALASALSKLRWHELPKSGPARGETEIFPPGKDGVGPGPTGGEGRVSKPGDGTPPGAPQRSRLIDPSRPKRQGGSAATGFNYREVDFEPDFNHLRSRYIPPQSLIEVNQSHADYILEREDDKRLRAYLSRLVVKEITLLNFRDMGESEIAERMVELETALTRQLT
jgi:hypothetical protein